MIALLKRDRLGNVLLGSDEALLVPGNVITNEPGIYIPGEAMGIRIENDFLVTETGAENLSTELPTKAEEIQALMND